MVFPEVCSVSGKNWRTLGVFEKSRIPALAVRRHQDYGNLCRIAGDADNEIEPQYRPGSRDDAVV